MNYLDLDMDLLKEEIGPRYNYDSGKIVYSDVDTDADMFFLNVKKISFNLHNPCHKTRSILSQDFKKREQSYPLYHLELSRQTFIFPASGRNFCPIRECSCRRGKNTLDNQGVIFHLA